MKKYLEINVLDAALQRIEKAILEFDDFYVSFSGGKDSGVLFHLVHKVAKKLGKLPVKVVFSDLEVIYQETVRYVKSIMDHPEVEPYWLCLEEIEDNASSVYQRYYKFWGEEEKNHWIRKMPTMPYVINKHNLPEWLKKYYIQNKMNYWTVKKMGEAFCDKTGINNICNFIGMRTDEAYGRYLNIKSMKNRDKKNLYTYRYANDSPRTWVCLPIYDWTIADVWHFYYENNLDYNKVYDSMFRLGIKFEDARTCYPFGETQKKFLNQWFQIEPETWERMLNRVAGVNFGKNYNQTSLCSQKVKKPENISWKQYTGLLLRSLPSTARKIFEDKFKITFRYHRTMYEKKEGIPREVYIQDSKKDAKMKAKETGLSLKYFISWESLANAIIRRDFVFKAYGFSYSDKMEKQIQEVYEKCKSE